MPVNYTYAPSQIYTSSTQLWQQVSSCGFTTYVPAPPQPPKDDDMLSKEHIFPYTGNQIADAIEAKLADLEGKRVAVEAVDDSTLSALGGSLASDAASRKADRLEELDRDIARWERERRAYAQAADKDFDLDLEDVQRFGL